MSHILALAGPAEAAIAFFLLIIFIVIITLFILGIFSFAKRNRWAAMSSTILTGLLIIVLQPWRVFRLPVQIDPDDAYWDRIWIVLSIAWLGLFLLGICSMFRAFSKKKLS
jgi:hypothetical protein